MPETRPDITSAITLDEFLGWYWLKTELVLFCRVLGLSTTGAKLELEDRVRCRLAGQTPQKVSKRRSTSEMPTVFSPRTVIGRGWRCNPALGAYFRSVCGNGFRFHADMRDFIHQGEGRTLAEAVACFQASMQPGRVRRPIAKQLEYNQHFQAYFAKHPGATRQQAIEAWWEKRSRRNGTRPRVD